MKRLFLNVITVAAITACGNGTTKQAGATATNPSDGVNSDSGTFPSLSAKNAADLPKCTDAINGALAYATEEETFYHCDNGDWAQLNIKGKDGADGKDGTDGTNNRMIASIHCSGLLDGTSLYFYYNASLMASGDVFANGSINDAYLQVYGSSYFSAQQNGAATASVLITDDQLGAANSGFWEIQLNRQTLVTSIDYHDTDATNGILSWVMTPDKCLSNQY